MAAAYQGACNLRELGIRMKRHCDRLIKTYEVAAAEIRDMANAHREIAAEVLSFADALTTIWWFGDKNKDNVIFCCEPRSATLPLFGFSIALLTLK